MKARIAGALLALLTFSAVGIGSVFAREPPTVVGFPPPTPRPTPIVIGVGVVDPFATPSPTPVSAPDLLPDTSTE